MTKYELITAKAETPFFKEALSNRKIFQKTLLKGLYLEIEHQII